MNATALLERLDGQMSGFLHSGPVVFIISAVILLNPVAIAPQVWSTLTATSVEAISIWMWIIFAFIQSAVALEGIRVKSPAMFFSMVLSVIESLSIITIVLIRG